MAKQCREAGIRFVVFPSGHSRFGAQLVKDMGSPDLSIWNDFLDRVREGPRWHVRLDSHLNEYGHRVYGEILADRMIKRGLVPSSGVASRPSKRPTEQSARSKAEVGGETNVSGT